jgi:hypothetical protein
MKEDLDPFIESLPLKVKTRHEVADEYGITVKTLISKLSENDVILPAGNIFPKYCKIIYYTLGVPASIKLEDKNNSDNGKKTY